MEASKELISGDSAVIPAVSQLGQIENGKLWESQNEMNSINRSYISEDLEKMERCRESLTVLFMKEEAGA